MPVEYVKGDWDPSEGTELLVKVAWGPESVQIACVGREAINHVTVAAPGEEGWYVDLDRRAINDLIKHLRRARDRAYGRDE